MTKAHGSCYFSFIMTQEELYARLAALTLQLQDEPDNAGLLKERGQVYYQLGYKNKSWQDLQRAIELQPELMSSITGQAKTPGRKVFRMKKTIDD